MTEKLESKEGEKEYIIKGVVKKRVLFSSRPVPLKKEDQAKKLKRE